jgi:hypothetical protein
MPRRRKTSIRTFTVGMLATIGVALAAADCGMVGCPQGQTLYTCEATIFYNSTCGCKKLGPQTVTDTECASSTPEAEKKSRTFLTTQRYILERGSSPSTA